MQRWGRGSVVVQYSEGGCVQINSPWGRLEMRCGADVVGQRRFGGKYPTLYVRGVEGGTEKVWREISDVVRPGG